MNTIGIDWLYIVEYDVYYELLVSCKKWFMTAIEVRGFWNEDQIFTDTFRNGKETLNAKYRGVRG